MASAWWVGLLWPIFFKGQAEKIVARIKLWSIDLTHLANFFFLITTYYFSIIKNISFSVMKKNIK